MKKIKKSTGITLIALVVTIVVLLILAGVSISMLVGENGVITQAQKAKEETEIGEEKEAISVAYSGASIKKQGDNVTAGDMQDEFDYNGTKANASGNINVQFTESKRWYKVNGGKVDGPYEDIPQLTLVDMFKQAQADNCELTHETCSNENHLHIGDYLDYRPNSENTATVSSSETGYSEDQMYTVDTSTTWRVLGLNEDETQILITSGSPIKRDGSDIYLHLKGAESYAYCEDTLDKISGIYKNEYASEARSMRIEDINRALGVVVQDNKVYLKDDPSKTNIDGLGVLGQTYTYKNGDYAPENYLYEQGDKTQSQKSIGDKVTATGYYYEYENPDIIDQDSVLWKLLFDGTTGDKNYAKSYWLASPGVGVGSGCAYFGPGRVDYGGGGAGSAMFISDGDVGEFWFAVRPVVSLRSNVTDAEVPITTGSEVDWNTEAGGGYGGSISSGQVLGN